MLPSSSILARSIHFILVLVFRKVQCEPSNVRKEIGILCTLSREKEAYASGFGSILEIKSLSISRTLRVE